MVVKVITNNAATDEMKVLSNPVYGNLVISIIRHQPITGSIIITEATGKLIFRKNAVLNAGNNIIDLGSFNQAAGIYYLVFTGYHGEKKVIEFIKK